MDCAFIHIVSEDDLHSYGSNTRERKISNSHNTVTYIKVIRLSVLKRDVKISKNTRTHQRKKEKKKDFPKTYHWKQQICETFSEKKPENAITLYHKAINQALVRDKHHCPAQNKDS